MPKYIEGIGIINPGDDKVLKRYIFKQRYTNGLWRVEGKHGGVPQAYASTYFWHDVINDQVMRHRDAVWVAIGRILYSVNNYPWE